MALDPTFVNANYAEAGLWTALGAFVLVRGTGPLRMVPVVALLAFGISDIVETRTGAWYRPWWLLAWKAACVLALLTCVAMLGARRGWFRRTRR
jgi:hypothetical protein